MNFLHNIKKIHRSYLFILLSFLVLLFIPYELLSSEYSNLPKETEAKEVIAVHQHVKEDVFTQKNSERYNLFKNDFLQLIPSSLKKDENIRVIPGGHSIGIHLETLGVLVVGHHYVESDQGAISPGNDANIEVGDIILKINGEHINNVTEVKPMIEQAGNENSPLNFEVKREDVIFTTSLQPVRDKKENNFSIGLYIRDTAAGIGTLSFYDPVTNYYGALGHVISDIDTKKPIDIKGGKIVHSQVTNIQKGMRNFPGEKRAKFSLSDRMLGTVTKNSNYGIFGTLRELPENKYYNKPIAIGYSDEVEEGPATILTVVNGNEIEEYSIEIVSNKIQNSPSTKGMVIKITDEELLNKTGGIVQGMSGSPIIQNNKIIGAVTHVFVNDPTTGYGVHIEWMLQDANIIKTELQAS